MGCIGTCRLGLMPNAECRPEARAVRGAAGHATAIAFICCCYLLRAPPQSKPGPFALLYWGGDQSPPPHPQMRREGQQPTNNKQQTGNSQQLNTQAPASRASLRQRLLPVCRVSYLGAAISRCCAPCTATASGAVMSVLLSSDGRGLHAVPQFYRGLRGPLLLHRSTIFLLALVLAQIRMPRFDSNLGRATVR